MADFKDSADFKALVAQTDAVLLTRGLAVDPAAVRDTVAYVVGVAAEKTGLDAGEAVHVVRPEVVVDAIVAAADDSRDDAHDILSVRPVRVDVRTVEVPAMALGRLVMTGSQAGKYASINRDRRTTEHAMDLVTELGAAILTASGGEAVLVQAAMLDELADVVERVLGRIDAAGWSICPCGKPHGQEDVDRQVVDAMRQDALIARDLRATAAQ